MVEPNRIASAMFLPASATERRWPVAFWRAAA
jgi:hypothetical protein